MKWIKEEYLGHDGARYQELRTELDCEAPDSRGRSNVLRITVKKNLTTDKVTAWWQGVRGGITHGVCTKHRPYADIETAKKDIIRRANKSKRAYLRRIEEKEVQR